MISNGDDCRFLYKVLALLSGLGDHVTPYLVVNQWLVHAEGS